MHDQDSKPVVLIIYAKTGVNLEMLKSETEAIESHLKSSGLCEVRIVPNATLAEVVSAINEPALRDRVAIVHYAGHANGQGIQLQSSNAILQGETAYMRGLAEVLKQQPHLRLLFINGCASREAVPVGSDDFHTTSWNGLLVKADYDQAGILTSKRMKDLKVWMPKMQSLAMAICNSDIRKKSKAIEDLRAVKDAESIQATYAVAMQLEGD